MTCEEIKSLHGKSPPVKGLEGTSEVSEDLTLFENSCIREWLTSTEAAHYLKVSIGSLFNMTSNGTIRCYKLGRRNRYRLADLTGLLKPKGCGGQHGY